MSAENDDCVCFFIPDVFFESLVQSDNIDEASKGLTSQTLSAMNQLGVTNKDPNIEAINRVVESTPSTPKTFQLHRKIYNLQWRTNLEESSNPIWRKEGDEPALDDVDVNKCYDAFGQTLEFFRDVFGRDSIDDNGMKLVALMHHGFNFPNTLWNPKKKLMIFGDGFENDPFAQGAPLPQFGGYFGNFTQSLEVIGHELMHGVIQHTAPLKYQGQSGASNESLADLFGTMIEQYAKKQTAAEANWLMGEHLLLPEIKGMAMRSLKALGTAYALPGKAGKDIQPAHMKDLWTHSADKFGVHINSGIPNHAFYLIATAFGGYSWEKAGQIWYLTLTKGNLKPECTFVEFAGITIKFSHDFRENAVAAVRNTWKTIGVL